MDSAIGQIPPPVIEVPSSISQINAPSQHELQDEVFETPDGNILGDTDHQGPLDVELTDSFSFTLTSKYHPSMDQSDPLASTPEPGPSSVSESHDSDEDPPPDPNPLPVPFYAQPQIEYQHTGNPVKVCSKKLTELVHEPKPFAHHVIYQQYEDH